MELGGDVAESRGRACCPDFAVCEVCVGVNVCDASSPCPQALLSVGTLIFAHLTRWNLRDLLFAPLVCVLPRLLLREYVLEKCVCRLWLLLVSLPIGAGQIGIDNVDVDRVLCHRWCTQ